MYECGNTGEERERKWQVPQWGEENKDYVLVLASEVALS